MRKTFITLLSLLFFASLSYEAEIPAPQKKKSRAETTLRKINSSLKEELAICNQMYLLQEKSLKLSHARFENSTKKSKQIEEQQNHCQEALDTAKKLIEKKEKENESLRRKVAGKKNLLSVAVIASSVVAILLILL